MEEQQQFNELTKEKMEEQQQLNELTKEPTKLSNLPNDIWAYFLNFLSAKDAVKACSLNESCRYLWKDMVNVVLDCNNAEEVCQNMKKNKSMGDMCEQLKKFLDALNASVIKKHFHLSLQWSSDPEDSDFEKLNTLVGWAYEQHVGFVKLNLELGYNGTVLYPVQPFMFDSESLRELEVTGSLLNISNLQISLPMLAVLKLSKMRLNASNLNQLISSCPLLEDLNMKGCKFENFFNNVASAQVLKIISGNIKHLTLWKCSFNALFISSMVINLPRIENASINLICRGAIQTQALKDLKYVEKILVGYRCIEAVTGNVTGNVLDLYPNVKLVELQPSLTCPRLLSRISNLFTAFSRATSLIISFRAHRGRWNRFQSLESADVLQQSLNNMINLRQLSVIGIDDTEIMVVVSKYMERDIHQLPVVASAVMKFEILSNLVRGLVNLKKLNITVGILGSQYFVSEAHMKNDALKLFEGIVATNVTVTVSTEPLILTGNAKGNSACLLH